MANLDQERVAERVRARRGELDLTQQALAQVAGVDVATISSLERAERWPWAKNRARIESALGWEPGALTEIAKGGQPALAEAEADEVEPQTDAERHIAATPGLSKAEIAALIEVSRAMRSQPSRRTGT
jgi:transcriptional regulator with XRE-family HTH domain